MKRWWGTDAQTRQQVEIDLIAQNDPKYLIWECKWQNDPLDYSVLQELKRKAEAAHCNNILLFTLNDLL